jgi:NAD(P)-dependent dehydrogenase (short-subunit alcohol dehydrogenase family)
MAADRTDGDPQPFAGRAAIVTGAAGGIGRAAALELAAGGASVLVADRRDEVEETASLVLAAGGEALARMVDVTAAEEVEAMVAAAVERFGRLDVLVNNAGTTGVPSSLADQEPAAFDRIFAVNVRAAFLGIKYAMPRLEAGGGAVVNVSSVTAVRPLAGLGAYSASKEAVLSLTRVAALEGAPGGVRVNAVLPGPTATRMIGQEDFLPSSPARRSSSTAACPGVRRADANGGRPERVRAPAQSDSATTAASCSRRVARESFRVAV